LDTKHEQAEKKADTSQSAPNALPAVVGARLTEKQREFAVNLVKGLSESDAYQAAFPDCRSPREAKNRGRKLARVPKVAEFCAAIRDKTLDLSDISVRQLNREIARIGFSDLRKLFDSNGEILPPEQWPDDVAAAVSSYKEEVSPNGQRLKREVKMWDKPGALRLIADLKGLTNAKPDATQRATFTFNFGLPPGARVRGKAGGRVIDHEPPKVAKTPQESGA